LAHLIFNAKDFYPSTKEFILFRDYDTHSLSAFFRSRVYPRRFNFLANRKIEKKEDIILLSKSKSLEEHFINAQSKQDRNKVIYLTYLEDGYSQIEIVNYLGLCNSAVSAVIKKFESGDLTAVV